MCLIIDMAFRWDTIPYSALGPEKKKKNILGTPYHMVALDYYFFLESGTPYQHEKSKNKIKVGKKEGYI